MSYRTAFDAKPAGETKDLVFNFLADLPSGETLSSAVVVSTLYSGSDASPSSLISGSASVASGQATQTITAGVAGNTYLLTCTALTSASQTLVRTGYLVVI